ncbi:MAG: T9SS type A sorting domain-containing protein [Saprospirales bacterium]|nr:T9SS type A sorting domain-containing protein [Saprospirales bacterium]
MTVLENKPQTKETSAPIKVNSIPFNWEYFQTDDMPFGQALDVECITVGGEVTSSQDGVNKNGYALHQNYPNPFYDNTLIEFILPQGQEATLVFFDATGRVIHTIQGDFKAGQNVVKIKHSNLSLQGGMLFYRLETAEYTSEVLKMTVIDR